MNAEDTLALQIKLLKLPVPERQFAFAKSVGRRYKADFAWPDFGLIAEVQGGLWVLGRHSRPLYVWREWRRTMIAQLLGYKVLFFATEEVHDGTAVNAIHQVLADPAAAAKWMAGLPDPRK